MHDLVGRHRRSMSSLSVSLGRSPSAVEIATDMGISLEKLSQVDHAVATRAVSFSAPVRRGENGKRDTTFESFFHDPRVQLNQQCEATMMRDDVTRLLESTLRERELHMLRLRYGLTDGRPRTLREISHSVEPPVTRERVRQILSVALSKMRTRSARGEMSEYLDDMAD